MKPGDIVACMFPGGGKKYLADGNEKPWDNTRTLIPRQSNWVCHDDLCTIIKEALWSDRWTTDKFFLVVSPRGVGWIKGIYVRRV